MKAKELEKKFDAGQDITAYLDLTRARRPAQEQNASTSIFPLDDPRVDREAERLGVPRQSLIKVLIAQHLDEQTAP